MEKSREILRGSQKYIAEAMRSSARNHPSGRALLDIDMTRLLALREKLEAEGHSVPLEAIWAKVVGRALEDYPRLNSRIVGDEIIYYDEINCGFGVDIGTGLYVVVAHDLAHKTLLEVANEFHSLVDKVENDSLSMDDTRESTFTLICMTDSRAKAFESLITNDQCILVGATGIRKKAVVGENDEVMIRPVCTLILTNEHAITDGREADGLTNLLYTISQDPEAYFS